MITVKHTFHVKWACVKGVWGSLIKVLQDWAEHYGTIYAVLGPVFDHNADGLPDVNLTEWVWQYHNVQTIYFVFWALVSATHHALGFVEWPNVSLCKLTCTAACLHNPVVLYQLFVYNNLSRSVGKAEIPLPSHYFAVVLRCSADDCSDMNYDVQAFIVPHKPTPSNCLNVSTSVIRYGLWHAGLHYISPAGASVSQIAHLKRIHNDRLSAW